MKELSIEQKAKAYDEAIERAKGVIEQNPLMEYLKKGIEYIFAELKENDSERIKKCISDIVKEHDWSHIFGVTKDDCLSWLKKQDEKKPCSEEDEEALEVAIIALEDMYSEDSPLDCYAGHYMPFDRAAKQLKAIKDRVVPQPNQEWSEEDEKIYQSIMDDTVQENQLDDKQTEWLRNIKYRKLPQPKQEWNEEDESQIRYLIECLEHCKKGVALTMTTSTAQEYINWLKSLRPQSKWSPSDAQMESIKQAVSNMKNSACYDSELVHLLQDLKKLREE